MAFLTPTPIDADAGTLLPKLSAADLRRVQGSYLQEGVVESGDLKVTTAGTSTTVSTAAGVGFVASEAAGVFRPGLVALPSTATELVTLAANSTANPRVDQVIARLDETLRVWTLTSVAGTATAGATLDNRTGAATDAAISTAHPGGWLRLADVVVPASSVVPIPAANIRDRRPWARGAFISKARTAGDIASVGTTYTNPDAAVFTSRVECSGAVLRLSPLLTFYSTSANATDVLAQAYIDGAAVAGNERVHHAPTGGAGFPSSPLFHFLLTPAAGSHLIEIRLRAGNTVWGLRASTTTEARMTIEEIVRQNTSND